MTVHKNVYTALAAAQQAMEPLVKGAINPAFKGEGKPKGTAYASLSDVVSAVREALTENGLAYFHQIIRVGDLLDMRTALVHGESDTRIECDVPMIVAKNDMQGMKSATTYAKRIGLESVTGIAPEDDDGNAAVKAAPMVEDRPRPLTDAFNDAVKDSLPPNATPAQTAEAYAKAIAADFKGKGKVALDNAWRRHEPMINRLKENFPKLHDMVVDACEMRANELKDEERA